MTTALACEVAMEPSWKWSNWAKVQFCRPKRLFKPTTEEEILQVVALAAQNNVKLKVVGSGHSPSDIACTDGYMLSLEKYAHVLHMDKDALLVTVTAGATLAFLNEYLFDRGLALTNLGSISAQAVAGALATGTHGSGVNFGVLASSVVGMRLITTEGQIMEVSRDQHAEVFSAALCGLGAVAIVSTVTMKVVPQFNLRSEETVSTLEGVLAQYPAIAAAADHVRLHWFPHTDKVLVNYAHRCHDTPNAGPPSWFWDTVVNRYMLEGLLFISRFCSPLIPLINKSWAAMAQHHAPSARTDRSDKVFNFDCLFHQYVNEWSIPMERFPAAIRELQAWIDKNQFVHFPIEVRFVRSDDIMLSPAFGRASCFIGVIMYRPFGFSVSFEKYFAAFEEIMMRYQGRPHWAKVFFCPPSYLHTVYPMLPSFLSVCARLDPDRRLWHPWHQRSLLESTSS